MSTAVCDAVLKPVVAAVPLLNCNTLSRSRCHVATVCATLFCFSGSALCEAISAAVYDALLAPVVAALAPLPKLPEWAGSGAGSGVVPGAGAVVPSFNAYPLAAVTAVGNAA